ncbi:dihydrofolate reductase family protein [Nonomuraea sp. CA-141351]|uniref:dihydrofolate reductase family protein n=1 Tax=Nonomuraea sp. CA-141351 TaxID=3239996 RepID=UPI003D8E9584
MMRSPLAGRVPALHLGLESVLSGLAVRHPTAPVHSEKRRLAALPAMSFTSIDGYIEDPDGGMDFLDPGEDFQQAANDHVRRTAAFLFGRRLYEAMEKPWTQDLGKEGAPAVEREFAQFYKETPRYVFSDTLQTVPKR